MMCLPWYDSSLLPVSELPSPPTQVREGVDLFDTAYPYAVSLAGRAFSFLHSYADVTGVTSEEAEPRTPCGTIDLYDSAHALDTALVRLDGPYESNAPLRQLVTGCECFACINHHRAYIHHLMNTQEMLGYLLLNMCAEFHLSLIHI